METVRVFVGCLLDLGATRRVVDLARALRRNAEAAGWKATWVPPPNLHVTLKFLGDLDAGLVAPLGEALAEVARQTPPLRLGLAGVGAFPDRQAPRVLFVEVLRGHEALVSLARAVDEAFLALGIPREQRPFHGHVTVARVKHAAGPLEAVVPAPDDLGAALVADVTLYRSDLLRQGAEYHVLARHACTGATPPAPREAGGPGQ